VRSLRFQENDQPWSENIKRSMVNMLQVVGAKNVSISDIADYQPPQQQAQQDSQNNDSQTTSDPQQQSRQQQQKAPHSYKQSEKTIEGDCEVAYSIIPGQQQQGKGGRKGRHGSRQQQQSSDEQTYQDQDEQENQQQQQQQNGEKQGITTVTKAVNFAKCRKRPELR